MYYSMIFNWCYHKISRISKKFKYNISDFARKTFEPSTAFTMGNLNNGSVPTVGKNVCPDGSIYFRIQPQFTTYTNLSKYKQAYFFSNQLDAVKLFQILFFWSSSLQTLANKSTPLRYSKKSRYSANIRGWIAGRIVG